jgi:hypothetical protein
VNRRAVVAAFTALAVLAGCSQKDPARDAIAAAEDALNAVYEDAQKYVPERYEQVKAELDAGRAAFDEERYADAISVVKDVPAHAEALAREAAAVKEKRRAEMNADWTRLSASLPELLARIGTRLDELADMRRLPEGMDKQLLEEARAAHASAQTAWSEAGKAFDAGDVEAAVGKARDAEGMAQDLVARLGMQPG